MDQRGAHLVFDLFVVTESGRANKKAGRKSMENKKQKMASTKMERREGRGNEREGERGGQI